MMDREAFLAEIEAVCRKHGISISHEDHHGSFELEAFSEDTLEWLKAAEFRIARRSVEADEDYLNDLITLIEPEEIPLLGLIRKQHG